MSPIDTQEAEIANWEYAMTLSVKENPMKADTLKEVSSNNRC